MDRAARSLNRCHDGNCRDYVVISIVKCIIAPAAGNRALVTPLPYFLFCLHRAWFIFIQDPLPYPRSNLRGYLDKIKLIHLCSRKLYNSRREGSQAWPTAIGSGSYNRSRHKVYVVFRVINVRNFKESEGSQAWPTALASGVSLLGVHGFESHPSHSN